VTRKAEGCGDGRYGGRDLEGGGGGGGGREGGGRGEDGGPAATRGPPGAPAVETTPGANDGAAPAGVGGPTSAVEIRDRRAGKSTMCCDPCGRERKGRGTNPALWASARSFWVTGTLPVAEKRPRAGGREDEGRLEAECCAVSASTRLMRARRSAGVSESESGEG
jgi:hypothetical protein